MSKRKAIPKKVRFEVFKRDSFTCQYCGKSAPDVILHVDHIDPVSKGGGNEIINLITSCADCNCGKGAVALDDQATLQKQRQQLAELSERREQLKMMVGWRNGLRSLDEMALEAVTDHFESVFDGWAIESPDAVAKLRKSIRDFGVSAVLEAIDISKDQYAATVTQDTVNTAFNRIGGICSNRSRPDESKLFYARGIVRNRMYCNDETAIRLLRDARRAGASDDDLIHAAKTARNWTEWQGWIAELLEIHS